jgi:hypothetical protein
MPIQGALQKDLNEKLALVQELRKARIGIKRLKEALEAVELHGNLKSHAIASEALSEICDG